MMYKSYKIPLHYIIKNNQKQLILLDAVKRTNELIIHVYQFIRLYILHKYFNNQELPLITEEFLKMVFKVLSIPSAGPKPKNTLVIDELELFYTNYYSSLCSNKRFDASNLSSIISYSCTDIKTNIENNIKLNFEKYLNKFVNAYITTEHNKLNLKPKTLSKNKLLNELRLLKNDFLNNTKTSITYGLWRDNVKDNIVPVNCLNLQDTLQENPQSFIKYMIFMNLEIEKLGYSQFQFLPLRTDFNLKYIPLDSKAVIELFIDNNKNFYLNDILTNKKKIWSFFVNLKHKIFKNKSNKYTFDFMLSTDGYATSLLFIDNKEQIIQTNKKIVLKKIKADSMLFNKSKTIDEIKKNKADKIQLQKDKQKTINLENKIKKQQMKTEYKEKIKEKKELEKQDKTDITNKKIKELKKINDYKEFRYLEDLTEEELTLISKNYVVVDPGKRVLLYMMNAKGKILKYSNKQRTKEQQINNNKNQIEKYKIKSGITALEKTLLNTCCKTCNIKKFENYILLKNQVYKKLQILYEKSHSRKYKWYSYINTRRTEDNLINKIKKHYGKNVNILMGDWSNGINQMKNFKSTPRIGLKRKLKEHFKVYNLDEYKTSKMCSKNETTTKNLKLKTKMLYTKEELEKQNENLKIKSIKKNIKEQNKDINKSKRIQTKKFYKNKIAENNKKIKEIKEIKKEKYLYKLKHSILTFKMNNRKGCINRDKNSCRNMLKIVEMYLLNKTRPTYLSRKKNVTIIQQIKP